MTLAIGTGKTLAFGPPRYLNSGWPSSAAAALAFASETARMAFAPSLDLAIIVGIVGHVRQGDLAGEEVKGKYYFPLYQVPPPFGTFIVRAASDPSRLAAGIREAVRWGDAAQPVSEVRLLSGMVESSLAPRRFVVTVLGVFAGMALLMAVIGLYGVISYAVTQRTQELGVRMALGAQPGEILRLVLGQGMRLAGMGAGVGLVASLAFSRLLQNQLFRSEEH